MAPVSQSPSFSLHLTVSTICRIGFVCAQARIETEHRRAIRADDLTCIAHIEVDMRVILRRLIPHTFELAAANAHDRHPDFVMKLRITLHLQRAVHVPDYRDPEIPALAETQGLT